MLWNQIIPEDSIQNKSNVNSAHCKNCKIVQPSLNYSDSLVNQYVLGRSSLNHKNPTMVLWNNLLCVKARL